METAKQFHVTSEKISVVALRYKAMKPTRGAKVIDLRGTFGCGQKLAGTGELVFEGELLELPARRLH
jgi:hypothetical protein